MAARHIDAGKPGRQNVPTPLIERKTGSDGRSFLYPRTRHSLSRSVKARKGLALISDSWQHYSFAAHSLRVVWDKPAGSSSD
jgi:hypothetical protein